VTAHAPKQAPEYSLPPERDLLKGARKIGASEKSFQPRSPRPRTRTQEGTVDDAPGEVADGDAVPLVVAVGVEVDDDPLAAVGAVNVTTGGGVEVEEVAAAIAGRLAAPDTAGVPTRGVAAIVERFTAPEPVVAVCTVAGPARAIRSGSATRYGWAISVSYPCVSKSL
jgi:hypothetical protein